MKQNDKKLINEFKRINSLLESLYELGNYNLMDVKDILMIGSELERRGYTIIIENGNVDIKKLNRKGGRVVECGGLLTR